MSIIKPTFASALNVRNILMQVSVTGIAALGMTIVILIGGIDLSQGWLISLAGCVMAFLMINLGLSEIVAVLAAIGICVGFETLMGFVIAKTRLEAFIVSLGFSLVYRGFVYLVTDAREITMGNTFMLLGRTFPLGVGTPVYIFVALTVIMWLVLKYTKFGMRLYALGGNEEAAYLSGVKIKSFKVKVYALNGLLVAVAAMTFLSRLGTATPSMGEGKEMDAIAGVVVGGTAMSGGKGNIIGTFIGILFFGCVSNALNIIGVSPYWQYVFKGVLICFSVIIGYLSSNAAKTRKKVRA
jgi:ribose/xylose/arabinose/galactoside ABC-type transport system permease subunit